MHHSAVGRPVDSVAAKNFLQTLGSLSTDDRLVLALVDLDLIPDLAAFAAYAASSAQHGSD
jgi:hypothetical protein